MNVVSLFDGMSCGQIALNRIDLKPKKYFASEIKKHAIKVTQENFPSTIQIGDVNFVTKETFGINKIDLLIGGSPCQDFTRLKINEDRGGLEGDKSSLFYEYLRVLKELREVNPDIYFLLENVKMKKEQKKELDEYLEVEGFNINSNLVSYQNRDRYYWTNIPGISQPEDLNINFQDFKETNPEIEELYKVNKTPSRIKMYEYQCPNVTHRKKINCLTCKQDRRNNSGLIDFEDFCRYLTREELEQAQTVPLGYTKILSYNQAQDVLGDGWTVDVICHILKPLKSLIK